MTTPTAHTHHLAERALNTMLLSAATWQLPRFTAAHDELLAADGWPAIYTTLYGRALDLAPDLLVDDETLMLSKLAFRDLLGSMSTLGEYGERLAAAAERFTDAVWAQTPSELLFEEGVEIDTFIDALALCLVIIALAGVRVAAADSRYAGQRPPLLAALHGIDAGPDADGDGGARFGSQIGLLFVERFGTAQGLPVLVLPHFGPLDEAGA